MTTERFDIEVQDKVARSIRTELEAIGRSAREAHTSLASVKSELAGLSGARGGGNAAANGIREQARAANDNARAIRAETAAIRERTAALEASARAASRAMSRGAPGSAPPRAGTPPPPLHGGDSAAGVAAVAMGARAASAELKTYAGAANVARHHSLNLAFQAQDLSMQLAMAAQSSRPLSMGLMALFQQGTQIQGIAMQSGKSYRELGMELLAMVGIVKTATAAEAAQAAAMATSEAATIGARAAAAQAAVMEAEADMALAVAQQRLATTATQAAAAEAALANAGRAVATAHAESAIAVEAANAANVRAAAANNAAMQQTTTGLTRFGRVGLAGLAALVVGFTAVKVAQDNLNDSVTESELTKGLGLTAKEMKKLEDVTITAGDVIKGTFLALGDAIPQPIKDAYKEMTAAAAEAWDWTVGKVKDAGNFIIGSQVAAYNILIKTWDRLPNAMADLFFTAVNMAIEAINELIRASVDGVNSFLSTAESAIGFDLFGELSAPQLEKVKNDYAGAAKEVGDVAAAEMQKALGRDYLGEAGSALRDRIVGVARDRLSDQAKEIIADRADKKGRKGRDKGLTEEEKRAKALADVNRELDSQIELLGFYGEALERETQFKAISNSLAQKGITLSEEEERSIRSKIAAIQEGKRVQDELNKIYEEAVGPNKEYAATLKAIDQALKDGIITEGEAERRRVLASNKLAKDSNPLYEYSKELARAAANAGLYGNALDDVRRAQELFDKAVAAGLEQERPGGFRDYLPDARKEREDAQLDDAFGSIDPREDTDTTSFILDNAEALYARLDELRQQDLISEEEAAERKKNLDYALGQARMEMASTVFGNLASLQSSKIKEVAAIGKAAAVAQATIDGIAAVQAALRGPPGPPWSYAIAAATGVSAAANVARIMGIGFERGGYTGPGGTSEVAGAVHRDEFVFDAVATRNIGVPALEAMRQGSRLSSGPANDNRGSGARIKIIQGPGTYTEVREKSDGEIELIAERAVRRLAPGVVAQDMNNPNGKTSKAMQGNFGARRSRA